MYQYILAIVLIIIGILFIIFPYHVWHIKHLWSVENGSPNESYITFIRITGVFSIIVGLVYLFVKIAAI